VSSALPPLRESDAPARDHAEALDHAGLSLDELTEEPIWRMRLRLMRRRWAENWRMFAKNKIGILGLAIIILFGGMAIAHPILMATVWDARTYDPFAGFSAPRVEKTVVDEVTNPVHEIQIQRARLQGYPNAQIGDVVTITETPAPPSRRHLLGTDPLGRDVLSQLLYSTRIAFGLAAVAAVVTVFLATTIGAIAAYYGGAVDSVLMRLADLFLLLPLIPVLVFATALFDINMWTLGLLIGFVSGLGPTAIVLKSQALSVTVRPFIDAAKVSGGNHMHVIFRHIVPNVIPLSFLYMMFTVTTAISLEAVLSFFGLLDVPMSWGIMVHTAQTAGYLLRGTEYWWLLFPAGLAVTLLAAAFYLVGRAMDEIVNPRLRAR
jgi:peptide/nickel transport system permease protein